MGLKDNLSKKKQDLSEKNNNYNEFDSKENGLRFRMNLLKSHKTKK